MNRESIYELLNVIGVRKIRDRGDWVSCSCPFAEWTHENKKDTNPSFGISVGASSFYHCFTCGSKVKGHITNLPTIFERYSNRDMDKLRELISKNEGLFSADKTKVSRANDMPESVLKMFSKLKGGIRGLTKETVKAHGLVYDSREDRMIIPVRDIFGRLITLRGRYLGDSKEVLRYREYSEFASSSPKKCGIWYGMDRPLVEGKALVLVEGEIDAMLLRQAGVNNVWASIGASITLQQVYTIRDSNRPVVLFFDKDKAGQEAAQNLYLKCKGLFPIYQISNYYNCKDAGEAVEKKLIKQVLKSIVRH